MPLQTSGSISFENIRAEFAGTTPIVLSHYYRGGSFVPNTSTNASVPTSGQISLGNFYGAAKAGAWTWVSGATAINEDGLAKSYVFNTTDQAFSGASFQWSINGTTSDFNAVSGSGVINGLLEGSFSITAKADSLTEGNESYILTVSAGGIQRLSRLVTVQDTSVTPPAWVWSSAPSSVNEGSQATFSFFDSNNTGRTGTYSWVILNGSTSDFAAASGGGSLSSNSGSFIIEPLADSLTEGLESYFVQVNYAGETIISSQFNVNDTSIAPATYSVAVNATTIVEGESVLMTVSTTGLANGTPLTWEINHSTTSAGNFVSTSGSMTVNNNSASVIITTAEFGDASTKSFSIRVKNGTLTVGSSAAISITDLVTIYISKTQLSGFDVISSPSPANSTATSDSMDITITGGVGPYSVTVNSINGYRVGPGTLFQNTTAYISGSNRNYSIYIARTHYMEETYVEITDFNAVIAVLDQGTNLVYNSNVFSGYTAHERVSNMF